jgi:hypothetical protein
MSTRTRIIFMPLLLWGLLLIGGCPTEETDDDSMEEFDPVDETGQADDDSAGDDDDTVDPGNPVVALLLQPESYVVDTETRYPLLAIATFEDGTDARVVPDTVDLSDPAVAEVDSDGVVTALAEGDTTLTATYGGVDSNTVDLTVLEPGVMTVLVIDASTGAPVEGAELFIGSSDEPIATAVTAASGYGALVGDFAGPVTVHCRYPSLTRTSIHAATSRTLRLPMVPSNENEAGMVEGTAVWGEEPGAFEVQFGLAATSMQVNPVFFDFSSMMSEERTLEVYGYEFEMPANMCVGGVEEGFSSASDAGMASVYALTGTFAIEEVQQAIEDAGEDSSVISTLVVMLAERMQGISFAMESGVEVSAGETTDIGVLEPFATVEEEVPVVVPIPPVGFAGDDVPVVLPLAEVPGEGLVLIGLGAGAGGIVVHEVERTGPLEGLDARYVAVVEVDGIGNGNSRSGVISDMVATGGEVLFPEFLGLPVLDTPEVFDYTWTFTGPEGADLYLAEMEGSAHTWHVWIRGDATGFELHHVEPRAGLAHCNWHQTALGMRDTSFESLIHETGPGLEDAEDLVNRQSRARRMYHLETGPE